MSQRSNIFLKRKILDMETKKGTSDDVPFIRWYNGPDRCRTLHAGF